MRGSGPDQEISISIGASYSFAPGWTVGMDFDYGLVHDLFGPWQANPEFGVGFDF